MGVPEAHLPGCKSHHQPVLLMLFILTIPQALLTLHITLCIVQFGFAIFFGFLEIFKVFSYLPLKNHQFHFIGVFISPLILFNPHDLFGRILSSVHIYFSFHYVSTTNIGDNKITSNWILDSYHKMVLSGSIIKTLISC